MGSTLSTDDSLNAEVYSHIQKLVWYLTDWKSKYDLIKASPLKRKLLLVLCCVFLLLPYSVKTDNIIVVTLCCLKGTNNKEKNVKEP